MPSALTLRVLGLPFGVDRQEQVFDEQTHVGLSMGDVVPCFFNHGFTQKEAHAVGQIGKAVYMGTGSVAGNPGHLFTAVLDNSLAIANKIYADAFDGRVTVSSDSVPHLVRPHGIVGEPGRVSSWPIVGLSFQDSELYSNAVNPRAVALPMGGDGATVWQRDPALVRRRDAAVKAYQAHQVKRAGLVSTVDINAIVEATMAERMPALLRRVQRDREWAVGLRDTRGR